MSGVVRAIGKAFKAVGKFVKKYALPALAIAAVVFTGGAAIGALPALGSVLGAGGLGLSAGLTSVLTTAATSATIGAGISAVTGGNIIKGATTGLITGGIAGGAGALMGGIGAGAASGAASAAGTVAPAAGSAVSTLPGMIDVTAALGGAAPVTAAAAGGGIGGAVGNVASWLGKNPAITGQLINGIGGGMMANEQMKQRDREGRQIRENYSDTSGLFRMNDTGGGAAGPNQYSEVIYGSGPVEYDRATGRIYRRAG